MALSQCKNDTYAHREGTMVSLWFDLEHNATQDSIFLVWHGLLKYLVEKVYPCYFKQTFDEDDSSLRLAWDQGSLQSSKWSPFWALQLCFHESSFCHQKTLNFQVRDKIHMQQFWKLKSLSERGLFRRSTTIALKLVEAWHFEVASTGLGASAKHFERWHNYSGSS